MVAFASTAAAAAWRRPPVAARLSTPPPPLGAAVPGAAASLPACPPRRRVRAVPPPPAWRGGATGAARPRGVPVAMAATGGGAPSSPSPPPGSPRPAPTDAGGGGGGSSGGGGGGVGSAEGGVDATARRVLLAQTAAANFSEDPEGVGAAVDAAAATAAAEAAAAPRGAAAATNGAAPAAAAGSPAPPRAFTPDPVLVGDVAVEAVLQELTVPIDGGEVHLRLEALGGRRRRMSGGIFIEAPLSRVWAVLTQYGRMAEFLPNIVASAVKEGARGEVLLDQTGVISRRLQLKSRMVLRVTEVPTSTITFSRVSGRDFTAFEGIYMFREVPSSPGGPDGQGGERVGGCQLDYSLDAVPMAFFPVALVERKIVKEMPKILAAIRREALDNAILQLDCST